MEHSHCCLSSLSYWEYDTNSGSSCSCLQPGSYDIHTVIDQLQRAVIDLLFKRICARSGRYTTRASIPQCAPNTSTRGHACERCEHLHRKACAERNPDCAERSSRSAICREPTEPCSKRRASISEHRDERGRCEPHACRRGDPVSAGHEDGVCGVGEALEDLCEQHRGHHGERERADGRISSERSDDARARGPRDAREETCETAAEEDGATQYVARVRRVPPT